MSDTAAAIEFGGLTIRYDARVLTPRPWTLAQSLWARQLLEEVPGGPVLELCAGVGHIGAAAVAGTGRTIVMVDRDEHAAELARENTAPLGDRVSIRVSTMDEALDESERFALVIADPPWVPSADVGRHPEDPLGAIDGGRDGLDLARECIGLVGRHLLPGGEALLQVGTTAQAHDLAPLARRCGLVPGEAREFERGVVLRLSRPDS